VTSHEVGRDVDGHKGGADHHHRLAADQPGAPERGGLRLYQQDEREPGGEQAVAQLNAAPQPNTAAHQTGWQRRRRPHQLTDTEHQADEARIEAKPQL
jgi:hypothetical protein